jgi:hypothetical protein
MLLLLAFDLALTQLAGWLPMALIGVAGVGCVVMMVAMLADRPRRRAWRG